MQALTGFRMIGLIGRAAALSLAAGLLAMVPAYAVAPAPGALTTGDVLFPHQGNGGYDALHYDVDLAWTPRGVVGGLMTGSITATTTIDAVTTAGPLSSFGLDFEGLTVSSVRVDGAAATYVRQVDPATGTYKLVVTPATAVDGAFTTTVSYTGSPRRHVDADDSFEGWNATTDGVAFVNQPIGSMTGFPNNNTPADKATYTFAIDIPTTITDQVGAGPAAAASNGELVSRTVSSTGARTTWVWDQREQMASELALISIGKYAVEQSQITLASGRVLPEWSFIDPSLSANSLATIPTRRAELKAIIDGLEQRFGPYPGNSTGIVVDRSTDINYALETQDRPFFPLSVDASTLVHEVAHQWYGDAVSPRVWNDIWINEGMATWSESAYADPGGTETDFFDQWADVPADDEAWAIAPAGMTDPATLYDFQTYDRGSMLYEALRAAVGDAAYDTLIREWQVRYGGQSRGGVDFETLAEEISGRDLTAFFQDWIYDADKPAWPATFDLAIASTPAGGEAAAGSTVAYAVSSTNTGKVVQAGSVVVVDLADVLDDATLDLRALPASMSLSGTTLTWTVPSTALGATTTEAFRVLVARPTAGGSLVATVRDTTLGSTCTACSSRLSVPAVGPGSSLPSVSSALRAIEPHGRNVVGRKLRVTRPVVGADTTVTYRWKVAGKRVKSSGSPRLSVRPAFTGKKVTLVVRATTPGQPTVTVRRNFGRTVRSG